MESRVSIKNGSDITTETCRPEFSAEVVPSGSTVFYFYTASGPQRYDTCMHPLKSQGIRIESGDCVLSLNYPETIK
jgi:hypothetical protein